MNDCVRRLKGLNRAAIKEVEATTASGLLAREDDEEPLQHHHAAEVQTTSMAVSEP